MASDHWYWIISFSRASWTWTIGMEHFPSSRSRKIKADDFPVAPILRTFCMKSFCIFWSTSMATQRNTPWSRFSTRQKEIGELSLTYGTSLCSCSLRRGRISSNAAVKFLKASFSCFLSAGDLAFSRITSPIFLLMSLRLRRLLKSESTIRLQETRWTRFPTSGRRSSKSRNKPSNGNLSLSLSSVNM